GPQRDAMRAEDSEAEIEREDEAVSPTAARHRRRLAREGFRELVVQRQHHGSLAGEVAIEQGRADAGPSGHVAQGRCFVSTLSDEVNCSLVKMAASGFSLGGATRRPASFLRVAIFSEHVYY